METQNTKTLQAHQSHMLTNTCSCTSLCQNRKHGTMRGTATQFTRQSKTSVRYIHSFNTRTYTIFNRAQIYPEIFKIIQHFPVIYSNGMTLPLTNYLLIYLEQSYRNICYILGRNLLSLTLNNQCQIDLSKKILLTLTGNYFNINCVKYIVSKGEPCQSSAPMFLFQLEIKIPDNLT